jgi:hypothetical protein
MLTPPGSGASGLSAAARLAASHLDPSYAGADRGHYDGYTQEGFDALPAALERIKGKFLLSSYRNKSLAACTARGFA